MKSFFIFLGTMLGSFFLLVVVSMIGKEKELKTSTQRSIIEMLEPVQAEAARRGDYHTAAAINFLQAAIVEGKQRDFALKVAPVPSASYLVVTNH